MTPDESMAGRVRASFDQQKIMHLLGAILTSVGRGEVEITLPFREELTQQHGFMHAGVITTVLDSACGYAALSVMPEGAGVLTIEFKTNLLAPARGRRFIARGRVVRAGRTIVVCSGDVIEVREGEREEYGEGEPGVVVATMLATMMVVQDRAGISD
ncbi:MAG TPA: PaaI family thioesterase [Chloroflexia bacterium]|nr:PaaI family thioesterase [Chloroflexia bacterium]